MKRRMIWGLGFLLVFLAPTLAAEADIINPHLPPEPCLACHTKVPSKEEAKAGQYFHLEKTIDATCKTCHACCKSGVLHLEMLHPSDVSEWDRSVFTAPKTLPLHNGKITCNTCHYHRLPEYEITIFMLRKVKEDAIKGMDWSPLCHDCHVGY
ncbi:MAG: hypothetical protein OEL66_04720 [Desulfobulbaceae bacterium]|nr:hypothetical protein [Desulfobulbaceae bacterium]